MRNYISPRMLVIFMSVALSSCGIQKEVIQPGTNLEIQSNTEEQKTATGNLQNGQIDGQLPLTDVQIKEVISKIDASIQTQRDISDHANGLLTQGKFEAEYIPPPDYAKYLDRIVVNLAGEKHEFVGVYGKEEMAQYMDAIKRWECKIEKWRQENSVLVNGISFMDPSSGDCLIQKSFGQLIGFSPSGYYLLYTIRGWEYQWASLVDIKTGKTVISIDYPTFHIWTPDKQQFIFAGWAEFWGCSNGCGLHATLRNSFPKDKTLTEDFIYGWYADTSQLYVKTYNYYGGKLVEYLRIYSLDSLDEIFSKDITTVKAISSYSEANPLILWNGFSKTKLYVKNGKFYSFVINGEEGMVNDWNEDFKIIGQDGYFWMWKNLYFAANAEKGSIWTMKSDSKYQLYPCVNGINIDGIFFVSGKKQNIQFSEKIACLDSDSMTALYDDSGVYILEIPSSGALKYFPGIDGKSLKNISENLLGDGKWNRLRMSCGPGGCEYSRE